MLECDCLLHCSDLSDFIKETWETRDNRRQHHLHLHVVTNSHATFRRFSLCYAKMSHVMKQSQFRNINVTFKKQGFWRADGGSKQTNKYVHWSRSCKRREILFQKSLLLFSTWREYFCSQPTHFSSQPKK